MEARAVNNSEPQEVETATKQKPDLRDDLVWGARGIADALGLGEGRKGELQVYHLVKTKQLKGIGRLGNKLVGFQSKLRRGLEKITSS
jgi:hypothetical protein